MHTLTSHELLVMRTLTSHELLVMRTLISHELLVMRTLHMLLFISHAYPSHVAD